jgi:hypothetical protein
MDARQLLQYRICVIGIGNDDNILLRTGLQKAIKSLLDQGFTGAKYIEELLGAGITAHRPKPAANSACHNYAVVIVHSLKDGAAKKRNISMRIALAETSFQQ